MEYIRTKSKTPSPGFHKDEDTQQGDGTGLLPDDPAVLGDP